MDIVEKTNNFPGGFIDEILTLLDRIETQDNASLATQRFDIVEKYGMTVVMGQQVSSYDN